MTQHKLAVLDNERQTVIIRNLTVEQAKAFAGDNDDEQVAILEHFEDELGVNIQNQEWMAGVLTLDVEKETNAVPRVNVYNLKSPRGNKEVPNQFIIETPEGLYFQSYQSIIAFIPHNNSLRTVLDINKWDYSTTTGKYRNQFLNETIDNTRRKIKDGVYILADLNK